MKVLRMRIVKPDIAQAYAHMRNLPVKWRFHLRSMPCSTFSVLVPPRPIVHDVEFPLDTGTNLGSKLKHQSHAGLLGQRHLRINEFRFERLVGNEISFIKLAKSPVVLLLLLLHLLVSQQRSRNLEEVPTAFWSSGKS